MKEEIVEDKKKSKSLMKFITKWATLITIVILFIFFTFANWNSAKNSSIFLTYDNMITIIRSISITAIIAIGLTYSLSVNGMDLSIGANANFADFLVMSMFVWHSMGITTSIVLSIVICLVIGLINSFLIVKMKIPDMVAALSTMFMFQGVAMTYSNGGAITERMMLKSGKASLGLVPAAFRGLGKEPWIIIIMLIVVLFAHFFLNYTKYGRYMYAVGGNPEAARLSGIPVNKYRILAYLLSASFAALGGILIAARVGTAQVNAGATYLMPAVAAAYIGFSVAGAGKPNALGTLAGAALVGMLENGLIMMSVPYYAMDIIKGAVLAIALALTYATKKEN